MMLGLLLARGGIDVVVLEKHGDFLRDFRGDTIHPSTLEVLAELGLLERFLALPHQEVAQFQAASGERTVTFADFRHLPTRCGFVAFIPQWDFLDFLAGEAKRSPAFSLRMETEAVGLVTDAGRVVGVRARAPEGELEVRADLVVACDGRNSVLRDQAGLPVKEVGAPIDVLWFRLSRRPDDPEAAMGRFDVGRVAVLINRGAHWQVGYVVPKDGAGALRERGLPAFRADIAAIVPFLADRVSELASWDDVPLLSVRVNRLTRWWTPGLLCIGDAAHAMSPVGGVGINLAIADAVAAANLLAGPLRSGRPGNADLARVQRRREFPTRVTQGLQVLLQNQVLDPLLQGRVGARTPAGLRLVDRVPVLRRIPGRLVGVGVRPEHVAPELRKGPTLVSDERGGAD
ncbi:MAG: FAD-dependent oxidoreductase [Actinomycetota bacterium]|nr:FAD-dependent oxidoreductase [Actinomycetota bacterium]